MSDKQSEKKWYLWISDKTSDKPLICVTGGGSMIGVNQKEVRRLHEVFTELITIWDERIQSTKDDPSNGENNDR